MTPELVAKIVSYATAIGIAWPAVQALIQRPSMSPKVKSWISIAAAVIFGTVGYIVQFGFNLDTPEAIITWVVGVYMAITVFYKGLKSGFYEPLENKGVQDAEPELPEVETDDADLEPDDPSEEVYDVETEAQADPDEAPLQR